MGDLRVVTGSFGYSGKYITDRLLKAGHQVRTLTNSPDRGKPFWRSSKGLSIQLRHPELVARSLEGASILYNTYWVRFNYKDFKHAEAVENTRTLLKRPGLQGSSESYMSV